MTSQKQEIQDNHSGHSSQNQDDETGQMPGVPISQSLVLDVDKHRQLDYGYSQISPKKSRPQSASKLDEMQKIQNPAQEKSPQASEQKPVVKPEKCKVHGEDIILLSLKNQEKICARCLSSTHLLHPVVPLNSLDQLDFDVSLKQEIQTSLADVAKRMPILNQQICASLRKHKITLRNHIIFIRDNLREEFDEFFNNLLQSIRKDWNLFSIQELLIDKTKRFNQRVADSLNNIAEQNQGLFDINVGKEQDLKKFYEQLSDAQVQVQKHQEEWKQYENSMTNLMGCLKDHSAFDVIDGDQLKGFMSENLVMNYSNVELNRVLFQQQRGEPGSDNQNNTFTSSNPNPRRQESPQSRPYGAPRQNFENVSQSQVNFGYRQAPREEAGIAQQRNTSGVQPDVARMTGQNFHRNSVNDGFNQSGLHMVQRPMTQVENNRSNNALNQESTSNNRNVNNKIHYFKFDQRTIHYYNVDQDKKSRELLNIEFNIPIRFCSIQTNDGKVFITGGAKNSSQSSNHAYEMRENVLVQLPSMLNPREGHCLAAIGSNFIYAIGSRLYNTSKTCEVYSVARNQWREQPELNRNRYLSTAVTIQDRYIYVLGGYEPSVTDIERLDTDSNEQPYWELIKVWSQSFENDIKYWFGACPVSQSEILIFGGKKDGASSASSYLFDTQLNQISKTGNMPNKDTFYQRTFLCRNGKVYAYGYENETAYIYSIQNQTWTKKVPQ